MSDWSSDVCSSELLHATADRGALAALRGVAQHPQLGHFGLQAAQRGEGAVAGVVVDVDDLEVAAVLRRAPAQRGDDLAHQRRDVVLLVEHRDDDGKAWRRSEEHTSELQSLMRISYAVFCSKKQTTIKQQITRRK